MRRIERRRKPLGEDDVLRAVVCDYVGPAECAINAEAGYTTAVASRAGLVARHTGPQREGAALPLPAESPAERAAGCVTRGRRCARANCRGPASQSDPAARASVAPRVPLFAILSKFSQK